MKFKRSQISSFSLYVILMMCIAVLIIIWSAHTRIKEHRQYHEDASLITTQKTANDISYYIQERRRLIHLFAMRNSAALWEILNNRDDEQYNTVLKELQSYFPNTFTYTISDSSGSSVVNNFNYLMGDLCTNDLNQYINTGSQNIRIHPSETYHFDIITHFKHKNNKGILFVSFNTSMISNSLLRAEIPGHSLLLTLPIENQLIEITSDGARNTRIRDNYKLSKYETSRILSQTHVGNTEWAVVDLHDETLLGEYKQSILTQSNLIIFILAISGLLFMILNQHEIKRRQKAEAAKDEFLSIVSHELRTPLTAINGAVTLLNNGLTGPLNDKTKSMLAIANNNTRRLTLLVNDLLDVQRLESRQIKYKRTLINPILFIESAITDIKNSNLTESCNINVNNTLGNVLVYADRSRMEQVIENILSNSIKYGSDKENIDIGLSRNNTQVIISITDYGEGITEGTGKTIFDKFIQTKMTDNRHKTGSGLGLYIAKMIVEFHGGNIDYISSPGKGTTFYIQLPIVTIKK